MRGLRFSNEMILTRHNICDARLAKHLYCSITNLNKGISDAAMFFLTTLITAMVKIDTRTWNHCYWTVCGP